MILRSKAAQLRAFGGWFLLTFAAAFVGALASIHARDFYQILVRPTWAPPAWLFGPVWSVLYLSMAVAAWLVWRERGFRAARTELTWYIVQLAANALWSWLFFGWHLGAFAATEVLALWILIFVTLRAFARVRPLAGWLLLPYLAWVTFAAILCFKVWRLNPGKL